MIDTDAQYQSSNKTSWNAVWAFTLWEINDCILIWKWKWLFVNGCESNSLISTVIVFLRLCKEKGMCTNMLMDYVNINDTSVQ
jgi:hypothetical protein